MSTTPSRDRMEQIWSSIQNWMENTDWTDPDAADRVTQAVNDQGVDKFIDPLPGVPYNEAASGNYDNIKEEFGLETGRERDLARRDFEDRQKGAAVDEIEDQFQEYGIQAVADAFEDRAPPALQERFDDVYAEYGPDFYRDIAFNEIGRVVDDFDIDAELISQSRLDALQENTGAAQSTAQQMRNAERQVIDRLERAFGQRFDDLDDAVESIRNRIDALQDLNVRSGAIRIRGNREGPPSITTEIGFGEFEDAAREQASRAINADKVDVRRTYEKRIGSVRAVGDDLQLIDLTPAQELPEVAGAIMDPDELVRRFEITADVAAPPAPEVTDPTLPDDDDDDDDEPTAEPGEVLSGPDRQGELIPDAEGDTQDRADPLEDAPAEVREAVDVRWEPLDGGGVNVNHFEVAPDKRGQGIGTAAMETLIEHFADRGREYISVNMGTGGRGADAVAEWLRGFGFEINETAPDHVDGILELADRGGDEDETPTPDAGKTGIDPAVAELVETANDAVDDGGIMGVGEAFTTDELFRLAAAAGREGFPQEVLDPVFEAFRAASADDRAAAAAANDGLGELQRALLGVAPGEMRDPGDVEIEFEGDAESIDDLIGEAEPERDQDDDQRSGPPGRQGEITDPSEDPEQGPLDPNDLVGGGNSGMIGGAGGIRAQPGSNRPDPNQQDADKKIASLLSNRLMKAQAWIAAEQERTSRGPENIERFWKTRGQQIWGNTLTQREFVGLTVNGVM